MGRDLFTRVCVGGRISIYIGLCCTAVMFVIGALAGALAGLKGGLVDDIIMRICELIGNLPYLIIVTILSMVMGRSLFSLVFAMSLTAWVGTARMVRGQILQIKEQDYVQAARALGASTGRIIIKHLLPNTLGIIMVDITMSIPGFVFSEAFFKLYRSWSQTSGDELGSFGVRRTAAVDVLSPPVILPMSSDCPDHVVVSSDWRRTF